MQWDGVISKNLPPSCLARAESRQGQDTPETFEYSSEEYFVCLFPLENIHLDRYFPKHIPGYVIYLRSL